MWIATFTLVVRRGGGVWEGAPFDRHAATAPAWHRCSLQQKAAPAAAPENARLRPLPLPLGRPLMASVCWRCPRTACWRPCWPPPPPLAVPARGCTQAAPACWRRPNRPRGSGSGCMRAAPAGQRQHWGSQSKVKAGTGAERTETAFCPALCRCLLHVSTRRPRALLAATSSHAPAVALLCSRSGLACCIGSPLLSSHAHQRKERELL